MRSLAGIPVLLAILSVFASAVSAARVTANVSGDSLTIGDRIRLTVSVAVPSGARVDPPSPEDGFGRFVVKQWDSDTKHGERFDSLHFEYAITTYTTGRCTIPSLPFVATKDGETDTLHTEPIQVLVHSVITTDSATLRELKAPFSAGRPSLLWLWLLFGGILAATAVYFGRRLWRTMGKEPPPPPPPPPYEEAAEALRRLESKAYPEKGMAREFVFDLTEIIKRYTGRRYEVNAPEFTTDELLEWVASSELSEKEQGLFGWLFKTAHPVKFARMIPDRTVLERMNREAWEFLNRTRPQPETRENPKSIAEEAKQ
ncbi:MAG: hypothetical protein GF344_00110 [Chitinivibrionales bacterium]|nr:hypothetical protein [Chitinivibrionales bacterium]MBD3355535.1 hypothetical protein [Chitinivibrionales bacterium]